MPSSVPGRSYVTRRAIVEIVRAAALESYGVTGLTDPRPSRRLLARLGIDSRPILVTLRPALGIELSLTVAYGLPVAEVVRQVDSAVRHAIRRAIGCEVGSIVVHVNGLRQATEPAPPVEGAPPPLSASAVLGAEDPPDDGEATIERPPRASRRRRSAAGSSSAASH